MEAPQSRGLALDALAPGDLEVFFAVAQAGSFRAAAERIGLSQPAVTQRIQRLEQQVGLPLFSRSTRRVQLTEAGQRLKDRAERTIHELRRTLADLRAMADLRSGTVCFAASQPLMAPHAIPAVMVQFRQIHPDIKLRLVDTPWNDLLEQLAEGRIELAFMPQEGLSPSLHCETLFTEELVPVASPRLYRSRRRSLTVEEFVALPVVGVSANAAVNRQLRALHQSVGSRFAPVMQPTRLSSVIGLMQAGMGVALLDRHTLASLSDVVELSVQGWCFERKVAIVRDARRSLSPPAERFAKIARAHFARTANAGASASSSSSPSSLASLASGSASVLV
jgi:DNA-binding transcriptional LysR family regulator